MAYSLGRCLLQSLLNDANMTQVELARRTGISPRMISYYIANDREMTYTAARSIATILGCHMEDLYE